MNKQELIDKLINQLAMPSEIEGSEYDNGFDYATKLHLAWIAELYEPEKPVVPKYVADWLEVCKDNLALSLANSMNNFVMRTNNQPDKTIHWVAKNSETFAKAWIYDYGVEKEKLYTVEIPNPNGSGYRKTYLAKNKAGKVELFTWDGYTSIDFADDWKLEPNAQLTEAEIKKDYAWAWKLAEEVNNNDD